jgi:mitochondrial enoyl-[acyl-carrier protein] reductase / trans-2-enoyl-CoA reductase
MYRVEISQYGEPSEVADCAEVPDVGMPGTDEVVFDVLASPINPADLAFCAGVYRLKPSLPAVPGAECVGRITAVGSNVRLSPGELVICLARENWAQRRRVAMSEVIALPKNIDVLQAAMLRINPPAAHLLLSDIVELSPGDWVVQNSANSAVGKLVIAMAGARGLRTVNVVRRAEVTHELKQLGADVCLIDCNDLPDRIRATIGPAAPIKLGLDAISGSATGRIAASLSDGGIVCTYGALSGENTSLNTTDVVFRDVSLRGFMVGRALARRSQGEIQQLYEKLAQQVVAGHILVPIARIYDIREIKSAMLHAQSGGRSGKILITPNGPVDRDVRPR